MARSAIRRILRHGVTGKGLNDYPAIFQHIGAERLRGWISIEDGDERHGARWRSRWPSCAACALNIFRNEPALRTAIIGCGKVAHLHAQALAKLPEAVLLP